MNNYYQEYIKIVTNVGGNLDNMKRLEREIEGNLLEAKLEYIKLSLATEIRPFKKYEVVDQFNKQFDKILARYKFLVIEGESRTGKTYFTKWMCGNPEKVYEVNCASCPEPEMRDFKSMWHQIVLFDEAAPEMVIKQKKLFQAPPCFVELGCSTTNCHSYKVLVSGTKLVICSNGWTEQVSKMKLDADKSWLHHNSFVLKVGSTPMFD